MNEPETSALFDPRLLDDCAREPIRIPGGIQPHGALLVLDPEDLSILQASANVTPMFGLDRPVATIGDLPGGMALRPSLLAWLGTSDAFFARNVTLGGRNGQVAAHRTRQGIILEFEETLHADMAGALHPRLQAYLEQIELIDDPLELASAAAREVRQLTGFGRALVYRFDPEWNGTVIAEDGDGSLPSYLDLRFPASDIPAQARELYRLNRLRLIPNASYAPVPIEPPASPLDGAPLDLSFAALRSVSPVHLEYMRNMGTAASMSVSVIVDGELWGLISCHNESPLVVDPRSRATCEFIGRIFAMRVGARERAEDGAIRVAAKRDEAAILERLADAADMRSAFMVAPEPWLRLVDAAGAALVAEGHVSTIGTTPSKAEILALANWMHARKVGDVYATDRLALQWPAASSIADRASGVLAIATSQLHASFAMWFRPEVVRTVRWAGDMAHGKIVKQDGLHPRSSFATWAEQVRQRALPWRQAEIETVIDFRKALVNLVLRRAEERAALSDELERSNKELEAFSYSVSHDLRAPFRHISGFAQLLAEREAGLDQTSRHYLEAISDSAVAAGRLVDDLLAFSQLSRSGMAMTRVDMDKLVSEVRRSLEIDLSGRNIEWDIDRLPSAWGDAALLRQALVNLIGNALKYTRGRDPARLSLRGEEHSSETVYFLRDNGVGFDMAYVSKIFGVFQRLHRNEEFEGTGIGLAITKRVIERHGGWIEAESRLDQGATFSFGLPKRRKGGDLG